MIRVSLAYALSGFVSLGYQVAWFRIFTDWYGSTNLTFTLVVVNFIGGLGVGALLSERASNLLARRLGLGDRLRVYGVIEILVSVTVLLTLAAQYIPADAWGSFPYVLRDGIFVQTLPYRFVQIGTAAACVFIPCLLMGITFPLLCHAFVAAPRGERFPATLYAWNTIGACLGVLACQFVLILWLGHGRSFQLMAGLNLLLGLYFLVTGGAPAGPEPSRSIAPSGSCVATAARERAVVNELVGTLLACASIGGLLSGALQGDLFRRIGFLLPVVPDATMSFISFWAILAIFIASLAVHHWAWLRLRHLKIGLVLAVLYCVSAWHLDGRIVGALNLLATPGGVVDLFPRTLLQLLLYVGAYTFAPCFLVSLLLPYVCNRIQLGRRHVGRAYGLNTLSFCLGMVAFTALAPSVSIFYSLKLFLVLMGIGAIALIQTSSRRPTPAWRHLVAISLAAIACVATPSEFDRSYFPPDSGPATGTVGQVRSNAAVTTLLVESDVYEPRIGRRVPNARLYFGRLGMSGTGYRAQVYMRLMAHFPLLAHPAPRRALLICFGVGITASAIASHPGVERIDVVDLNEDVFTLAPGFGPWNGDVHLDPRLRLINDDGRSFLRTTDQVYDLITSEPPPPLGAGVYRLYSREYYQDALAHLSPEGLMTQWLPVWQMPPAVIKLAVRTFLEVFPNALLFEGFRRELILVGSPSPIDLTRLAKRFSESDSVLEDLRKIDVDSADELVGRIIHGDSALREKYPPGRVISDQHNDLSTSVAQIEPLRSRRRDR